MENPSVTAFRDYLRIKSVQPDPDYDGIVKFLTAYSNQAGFPCRVYEAAPNRPIVIITVEGEDPTLPSVLLNSHTDVVPVFVESWSHDPFAADKTADGKIFARGSQDMKCVGIQHLEAVKALVAEGVKFRRTVHMSFVPDEEIGGVLGMKAWIATEDFRSLNVGFALDEGLANQGEEMRVFFAERMSWWGTFHAKGNPGHGSQFIPGTAAEKVHKIMGKMLKFREEQEMRLKSNSSLMLGNVCTINITSLKGGVQSNVVPADLLVGFDLRVCPSVKPEDMEQILNEWATECDVTVEWQHKQTELGSTSTDPEDVWWKAFSGALQSCGVKYTTEVFPAGTDSRYLRNIGLPAIGFSPMNNTPILLHDHDEYLDEDVFLRGIAIFKKIIQAVADVA